MTIREHKEFPVESSSLKEIRNFAREVLSKDPIFENSKDDVVLALQKLHKILSNMHIVVNRPGDKMKVEISFNENQLIIELFDKGSPAIPENIKPRKLDDIKAGGLGTFFIGQIMDEVTFKTSATDWVNHLVLKKIIKIFVIQLLHQH